MKSHDDEFQRQVAEATRRGEEQLRTQPWAVSVKYDRRTHRLVTQLNNGTILSIPVGLVPELSGLSEKGLANVAVLPPGFYLDWPQSDIQVSIAWLLTGMYANPTVTPSTGQQRGSTNSKTPASSRANGIKGGRPRIKRKSLSTAKSSG